MIHKVFAIRDDKAEAYMPPICFVTRGQAVRWFTDLMHDSGQEVAKHPEDYKLMFLGDYDIELGVLTPAREGPAFIVGGLDVVSTERGGL